MRLDMTPDLIEKNALNTMRVTQEDDWTSRYASESPWTVKLPYTSSPIELKRLVDRHPDFIESYLEYARTSGFEAADKIDLEWSDDLVQAPNVTDKDTVITLALMSSNAYVDVPDTGDWRDVGWNHTVGHGWNGTGVRGHIFVSDDNSTVVIAYKGTSAAYLSGSGSDDTVASDRDNDNLLFSCCCARVSYMWTTVCDCYQSSYTCDQRCLVKELYRKDRYYQASLDIFRNVTNMYPNANIWTTGHSLGGAMASLVGRTFGAPAVAFESPGELLATKRLHLPMPPGLPGYMEGIWHFGHTADPIFMGVCNGASSTCSMAGYAMETQCHSGKMCVYDVVADKGWHVNMLNHRIHTVIDDVIAAYNETAPCIEALPCRDCFNWNFVDGHPNKPGKEPDESPVKEPEKTKTTSTLDSEPTKEPACKKWTWYGRCAEWEGDKD
jgi:lipase ATG15